MVQLETIFCKIPSKNLKGKVSADGKLLMMVCKSILLSDSSLLPVYYLSYSQWCIIPSLSNCKN